MMTITTIRDVETLLLVPLLADVVVVEALVVVTGELVVVTGAVVAGVVGAAVVTGAVVTARWSLARWSRAPSWLAEWWRFEPTLEPQPGRPTPQPSQGRQLRPIAVLFMLA